MKIETVNWLRQAQADINTAEHSLVSRDYYASAFWSHQAIEKTLKAVLIEKSGELFKMHDLVILSRMCKLPKKIGDGVRRLSGVYTESRYGILAEKIPAEKFNNKDAVDFLKIAKEVLEWSRKEI